MYVQHTLLDMVSTVARQSRQRQRASPTPTLKPPIACTACVSASITSTAPFTITSCPFKLRVSPWKYNTLWLITYYSDYKKPLIVYSHRQ